MSAGTQPRARSAVRRRPVEPGIGPVGVNEVEVRRSARRTRSVSAYRDGSRVVILVPARISGAEEDRWVGEMLTRLRRTAERARVGDADLARRAAELSERHLESRAQPRSVTWSTRQQLRWGSCTPDERTIRISERLRGMPGWVLDYVLLHELVHLLEPDHGPGFWSLIARYPRSDRAQAFLDGVSYATNSSELADPPGGSES